MKNKLRNFKNNMLKEPGMIIYLLFILAIAVTGIYLRLWWIHNIPTEQKYDFATYQSIAQNIYDGKGHTLEGYPVAWQGSAYSYALAFFYKIAGNTNELTGKFFNLILSSITLLLSYFVYKKIFEKRYSTAAAFAITAFLPNLIAYNNVLGTETLFLFLIAVILAIQFNAPDKKITYVILGILSGIAALTKPYMLAYPFILGVIRWTYKKDIKKSLVAFGIMALSCIVIISPWTLRNYRLFGRLIPVSYNSGYVLYINNNDSNVTGSWLDLSAVEKTEDIKDEIERYLEGGNRSIKTAHDIEPLLKSEAAGWIKNNPVEFLKLGFLRLYSTFFSGTNDIEQWAMNGFTQEYAGFFWTEIQYARNMNLLRSLFDICVYILSASGFIFLFASLKKYIFSCFTLKGSMDYGLNVIFLNTAFFIVIDFVFEGQARYVFPTIIFLIAAFVKLIENTNTDR